MGTTLDQRCQPVQGGGRFGSMHAINAAQPAGAGQWQWRDRHLMATMRRYAP